MKDDYLRIRMSKRRMDKLRLYATMKDTTMTHVIEDLIDSLKIPEIGNQGAVPPNALTDGQQLSGDAP
ncbi:hypothetical protein NIES4073_12540 [Kalymmatonema gypsitolerans NIES-4073]|nr:hypothetical protein NIES4073_12540 [Scytonema sp. NIES-4073]